MTFRDAVLASVIVVALSALNDVEDYAKAWAIDHGYAYLWRER